MDTHNQSQIFSDYTLEQSQTHAASKTFMANVFLWMFAGLGVSAFFAWLFASNTVYQAYLTDSYGKLTLAGDVVLFAPIGFVLIMGLGYNRLSATSMALLFMAFAAVDGTSFSFLLIHFATGSIVTCFLSSAAMFGVMAVMGYTTNKDLTSFGRIMTMGFFGLLFAILTNVFLHSAQMDYIISIVGVAVFTGLTAYKVQQLKQIGIGLELDGSMMTGAKKMSIYGALVLYLAFVNLFMFVLRLFGRRR